MTWVDIIKNWLSVSKEHNDEIKQAQDDFMNAFVEKHQGSNEFDLITIEQVFTMAYCLGKIQSNMEANFNFKSSVCTDKIMKRREEIRKAAEYQYQYADNIAEQEAFKNGMVIGAEWADANPAWIRPVDEMPPIGINVLTRVIKGDGGVVYQVDRRTSYEWVNLCHYDKITHWMRIRFKDEE